MILVDTSVWVNHLRDGDAMLAQMLKAEEVLAHPYVTGEIALGHVPNRNLVLADLQGLPQANVATHEEFLYFVEHNALIGLGIGFVDTHLLASVHLTPGAALLTRDKRLSAAGKRMGLLSPASLH